MTTLVQAGKTSGERLGSFRETGTAGEAGRSTREWLRFVAGYRQPIGFVFSHRCRVGPSGEPHQARLVGLARGPAYPAHFFSRKWFGSTGFVFPLIAGLVGCGSSGNSPLIVATHWPATERTQIESIVREAGDRRPIHWITLAPGERLESVVDRRGGVDVLLGGPSSVYSRLAASGRIVVEPPDPLPRTWRPVRRPGVDARSPARWPGRLGDPRVEPDRLALAKSTLGAEGWPKGYERLVLDAARPGPVDDRAVDGKISRARSESVALVQGGPNPGRAREFLTVLSRRGLCPPGIDPGLDPAAADDLLADLLGAAMVDALDELREAVAALDRFGHPAEAEAAIGERPPWPPASVAKLQADPNGAIMIETLLEQIAPDPEARAWLVESWSKPKRPVDGALLAEIAEAVHGGLVREPRFRAWLRGEWTAWTRQLYRRVARVAGGYGAS